MRNSEIFSKLFIDVYLPPPFLVKRQRARDRKEVLRTKQETRKKTRSPRDAKVTEGKPEEKDERTGQMTEENRFKHFFFSCIELAGCTSYAG